MDINEAKQFLNSYGYILENAFSKNTDMKTIFAIIEEHGWNPDKVAKEIIDYYNGITLKTSLELDGNIFYKKPTTNQFNNFGVLNYDELENKNENDKECLYLALPNFNIFAFSRNPQGSKYGYTLLFEDETYKLNDKLVEIIEKICKEISSKTKYFKVAVSYDNDSPLFYDSYVFCPINFINKVDLSKLQNKEKEINDEIVFICNSISQNEELNDEERYAVKKICNLINDKYD